MMNDIILEGRNLTKRFGAIQAVSKVDFALRRGEILGVIGPNGAGKTTLFNVIAGLYPPDEGEVILKGRSISGWKPHRICREGLSKTSQAVRPFTGMTVMENVLIAALYGRRLPFEEARREAEAVTEFVGLGGLRSTPSGSITFPNRRRLELARALATGAEVILLDENMAGLNPAEIDGVMRLLREIQRQGRTLIVVEHVMRAVMEVSDRIMVLNYGRKIVEGTPREVADHEKVIEAYLGEKICFA
jgi:branched-chain amino acid transport system ATP-binding protein